MMAKYAIGMVLAFSLSCGVVFANDPNDADYSAGVKAWLSSIDPNSPAMYSDGFFNLLARKWLKKPKITVWRTARKVSLPPKRMSIIGVDVDDPEDAKVVCRFTLKELNFVSFGWFASTYQGGLKWKLPPPPVRMTKFEAMAALMRLLFMETE